MSTTSAKTTRYKQLRGLLFFTMLGLSAVLAVYSIFAPKPPIEIKSFTKYSGSVTVSHQKAILNAQLGEHSAKYVLETLGGCKFFEVSEEIPFDDGVSLRLGKEAQLLLTEADGVAYARVENESSVHNYRLSKNVYKNILDIVYTSFPNGVQVLDLQPWWEEYLAIAAQTLMADDFNSPKEISPQSVVDYTFQQMIADGSAHDFEAVDSTGKRVNTIPYQLFLTRGREYFADGASPEIKKASQYSSTANCFVFPAPPIEFYGKYPYNDFSDYRRNGYYSLKSLTRDLSGNITAVFEDYNRLGFRDRGVLNKIHDLTMVSSSDGKYRFVSKASRPATPVNTSVEGYFMRIDTLGTLTADHVYDSGVQQGGMVGADFLLYSTKYTKDKAYLNMYTISALDGSITNARAIEADASTVFFDVKAVTGGVIIKTNRDVTLLNSSLVQVRALPLPLKSFPNMQSLSYDVTDNLNKMILTDDTGMHEINTLTGTSKLIAKHPYLEQSTAAQSGAKSDTSSLELLTGPAYVLGGNSVLVSLSNKNNILQYSVADITAENPTLRRLDIPALPNATEYVDNNQLVVQFQNTVDRPTSSSQSSDTPPDKKQVEMIQIVHDFASSHTASFSLQYDLSAPGRLIYGGYIYYFKVTALPSQNNADTVFELMRTDLSTAEEESLPIKIINAIPQIVAADNNGRVLFSYRSTTGTGFGITNAIASKIASSDKKQ